MVITCKKDIRTFLEVDSMVVSWSIEAFFVLCICIRLCLTLALPCSGYLYVLFSMLLFFVVMFFPLPIKHCGNITSRSFGEHSTSVPSLILYSATIFSSIPHSIDTSLPIHQTQFQTPLALRNAIKHCHSTLSHGVHELPYVMGISMNTQDSRIT